MKVSKTTIRRLLTLCFVFPLSFPCLADSGSFSGAKMGIGIERYTWTEHPPGVAGTPKETGDRLAIFLGWKPHNIGSDPYVTYVGKIYLGTVDYNTFTMVGNIPVQTTTDYLGMMNEARAFVPIKFLNIVAGLGYDYWNRVIADGLTSTLVPVSGNTETYGVMYLRLGVSADIKHIVALSGGIKHTIFATEDVGSFGTLHPGTSNSPYGEVTYNMGQHSSISAYFDSYRFTQSAANSLGFYQPKSDMNAVGIKFDYWN
jgi:hypothetical protein